MEKLKMQTPNKIEENLKQIAKLFPHVITENKDQEGNITKAIDFDLLKQSLSSVLVEDDAERYRLDWPGKKASLLKANTPINKTLRPCRDESVNFDTTENLYLEGDNFEVLKTLQESYLNKVKMIYIDPPYNTGKDFVYTDKFKVDKDEYEEEIGLFDEEGGRLFKNTDTNGRFHSDWLSMMYERLIVARDLLKDDGVIFISIDDNEVHNLRKICDEVFGEENLLAEIIWNSGRTSSGHYTNENEYIIAFAKNKEKLSYFLFTGDEVISDRVTKRPSSKNPISEISFPAGIECESEDKVFPDQFGAAEPIKVIKGIFEVKNRRLLNPVTLSGAWAMKDMIISWLKGNEVIDQKGQRVKRFYFKSNGVLQYEKIKSTIHPKTTINNIPTKRGSRELQSIFGINYFDFPKPSQLIMELLRPCLSDNDVVIDFFSGSATTAHAVMQLNAEDGGNRKFIMVQLPEKTDESSEAYKAGYQTISDIGKERIRRAGKQIMDELRAERDNLADKMFEDEKLEEIQSKLDSLDIGFRVYKTDSSNMKDVFYHPNDYEQMTVDDLVSNTKEDRSPEDLLTQVILELGLELNLPIEKQRIKKNDVYFVLHKSLVACFDDELDFDIIDEIAKVKPLKVVFKDSSFKDDKDRINLESRFKRLSPDTAIKVL
ncbi:site-specific DNA-methyltransferase [bacterium]|nr:site-specific DNA-methyltransferase [bacterium]